MVLTDDAVPLWSAVSNPTHSSESVADGEAAADTADTVSVVSV